MKLAQSILAIGLGLAPLGAFALDAAAIDGARFDGGPLAQGQTALTVKLQVLLDRAGVSPGVIDGYKGGMSRSALMAFETREGLPADGVLDTAIWERLQQHADRPIIQDYTITQKDVSDLTASIPSDYLEKANMTRLGYTSVAEKLGERFHMDEDFISTLNPGVELIAGQTIKVVDPGPPAKGKITRIVVEKEVNRVAGFDAEGRMLVNYPATIGSDQTPSPSGQTGIDAVAIDPTYSYLPAKNFQQGDNSEPLEIPPGPNGPVGSVWIDLSKDSYGIHGTPTPSTLFQNVSHGCVRLANWDAHELAHMVSPGTTVVEFLEPGQDLPASKK